eukprot:3505304-Rhodomonas_salina.2
MSTSRLSSMSISRLSTSQVPQRSQAGTNGAKTASNLALGWPISSIQSAADRGVNWRRIAAQHGHRQQLW